MPRYYDDGFPEYVSVAQRRGRAALSRARLERGGRELQPVAIDGRTIATTFWGPLVV